jgi:hypothetical protein
MSIALRIWLLLGACAAPWLVAAEESPLRIAPPTRIPDPPRAATPGQPMDIAAVPRTVRRAIVADAARRFRLAENSVVLTGAEKVIWNDTSLDCPLPGQVYAQLRVPGFRVFAKTSQGALRYHTDLEGRLSVCR